VRESSNAGGSTAIPADIAALGFEEAFEALDAIVAQLEGNELSLDQSIDLYEHGVALTERCSALLAAAELRVREVDGGD
jgi:exodeoxyribonuclease VII small subunit